MSTRSSPGPGDHYLSIEHGGRARSFWLHVPRTLAQGTSSPLLVGLHGGGQTGGEFRDFTLGGFDMLADQHGWIVAYPEAVDRVWNDGRKAIVYRSQRDDVDDVGYVGALIDHLSTIFNLDRRRIYATGASNGAILCHWLACSLADRIAATAPVAGSMAENVARECSPPRPVSVMIINGTKDPLIPWEGGQVVAGPAQPQNRDKLGAILSAEQTALFWARINGCSLSPSSNVLSDERPSDGMPVRQSLYGGGRDGSEVALVAIEGAGHAWPGGTQYAPESAVGRVKKTLDGCQLIWDFFTAHARAV